MTLWQAQHSDQLQPARLYAHCTQGHLALLAGRTPISRLLADPATPAKLSKQLQDISHMRDFASSQLHLPDNDSYRGYSDLQRPYVTWNVVATEEFNLQPLRWCFPLCRLPPLSGAFLNRRGLNLFCRAQLRQGGHDTYVYGVVAISTLGWYDDRSVIPFSS
ncbi:MAG: aminopeptidase [Syntrophotaleaceae bacterium]